MTRPMSWVKLFWITGCCDTDYGIQRRQSEDKHFYSLLLKLLLLMIIRGLNHLVCYLYVLLSYRCEFGRKRDSGICPQSRISNLCSNSYHNRQHTIRRTSRTSLVTPSQDGPCPWYHHHRMSQQQQQQQEKL
jgi:hypothetical protein